VLAELADVSDIGAGLIAAVAAINNEDTLINERTAAGMRPKLATPGQSESSRGGAMALPSLACPVHG
jgi:hypothetical protein